LTVWIPELEAAFTGDLYYESFPNIYTLRGTQPRWALDYVKSLDRVIALEPKLLVPSHGEPVKGKEKIRKILTQYRDAILYVHDAVVAGMNEGEDVATLMREIRLPPELDVGENYGRIDWSVRGIYEGYAGWFDGEAASMYAGGAEEVAPDLVELSGGTDAVAARAQEKLAGGDAVTALRLANMALAADSESAPALEARLAGLEALLAAKRNFNETGWLTSAIKDTRDRLNAE
ncbi:MAG: alkyl sulfatase dimerization domain-containing protein, partial [Amphiplicatus sp.]